MFWGIVIKAGEAPTSVPLIARELIVTMAVFDPKTISDDSSTAHLFVKVNGRQEILVCTLRKNHLSHGMNLEFEETDRVAFLVKGSGSVHLTGNVFPAEEEEEPPPPWSRESSTVEGSSTASSVSSNRSVYRSPSVGRKPIQRGRSRTTRDRRR